MELDRNYFNSIRLNTRRGKFYDIEAVDRLLVDIRARADSMNREYTEACRKLAEAVQTADSLREENSELFMKGQALSQEVLALRDELKAAQSGEAFVIPEESASVLSDAEASEDLPSAELQTEKTEEEDLSSSPAPHSLSSPAPSDDDALMPPELVTSAANLSLSGKGDLEATEEIPSPSEDSQYVISSSSPKEEADKIIASAYAEAAAIRNSAQQLWDNTVSKLDSVFSMIREINTYSIEKTDRIRQEFLDRLPEDEAVPSDVTEKIGRIALELTEIEEDESHPSDDGHL